MGSALHRIEVTGMYKVLIVDDEMLVRIGLKSMIDWEKTGYEIAGEAGNGEAAFEKYLALQPQVLITDIKMPKKDGFWLIRKVKDHNPNIRIVVLTCYDEFNYVREALKLQVSDYVLKAEMEEEEIETIMQKIKTDLDESSMEQYVEPERVVPGNTGQRLIGLILDKDKPVSLIQSEFQQMGFDWGKSHYCFLQIDFSRALKSYTGEQKVSILAACAQVAENRFRDKGIRCEIKQFRNSLTCLLISDTLNQMRLEYEVEGLQASIYQYFNIRFKSTNSEIVNQIEKIHENPDRIFKIADFLFYYEEGSHVAPGKDNSHTDCFFIKRSDLVIRLYEEAEKGNEENIQSSLEEMRHSFISRRLSSMKAKLEMVHTIDDILKRCGIYIQSQGPDTVIMQKNILDAEDIQEALAQMEKFLSVLTECIVNAKVDNADAVIRRAIDYMEQHYAEKLTLDEVAGYVGISKYYFSNLFNKICDAGFSSYLNEIRIREAKKMLKNPQMNVKQVAYLSGYNDQQYFSKTFKKYTGMTITEYRKKE